MIYIYMSAVCMSTICQINCVGGITWTKHAHAQSQVEQLQHGLKRNVHLEMRNLKQTELRILKNRGKKAEDKTRK